MFYQFAQIVVRVWNRWESSSYNLINLLKDDFPSNFNCSLRPTTLQTTHSICIATRLLLLSGPTDGVMTMIFCTLFEQQGFGGNNSYLGASTAGVIDMSPKSNAAIVAGSCTTCDDVSDAWVV